jgi:hypothetical protein
MQDEQDYYQQEQPRTIEVYDRDTEERLGHVTSLSPDDLTVVTPLDIETGKLYPLRIGVNLDTGWTETVTVDGEAVESRQNLGSEHRQVRFRLVDITEGARSQLERLGDGGGSGDLPPEAEGTDRLL